MYHLTADSEVVFFFVLLCGMDCWYIGGEMCVGRRYSVGFNLGWGDIEIPVGFFGEAHRDLLGVGEVWGCFWLGSFFHLIFYFFWHSCLHFWAAWSHFCFALSHF